VQGHEREQQRLRRAIWTLFAIALIGGLAFGAADEGLYKAQAGPYAVKADASVALPFGDRERPLEVRVTWPDAEGPFPLIVFSHGMGGSKDGYQPLIEHWVSHGYVCIQPTHADSVKLLSLKELREVRSLKQYVNDRKRSSNWDERPREIKAILDQLDRISEKVEGLGDRIDRERIAVAGHSFGAHTAAMIAGLKLFAPGGRSIQIADDRPDAALIISPQGVGRSIKADSWDAVEGPVMMITGSKDDSPRHEGGAEWRMTAWQHLGPGPDRQLLYIDGAHHSFGGISGARYRGAGPRNDDHVAWVRSATTAYFDALLKGDDAAGSYLRRDDMHESTDGKAKLTTKPDRAGE